MGANLIVARGGSTTTFKGLRAAPPTVGGSTQNVFGEEVKSSGDEGDRTLNLRLAKPALSQLSYVPEWSDEERPYCMENDWCLVNLVLKS